MSGAVTRRQPPDVRALLDALGGADPRPRPGASAITLPAFRSKPAGDTCRNGHPRTPDNLVSCIDGALRCRACRDGIKAKRVFLPKTITPSARVVVRCGHCAGVFEDAVDALSPCPYCHRFARGAA
jgi:hypothetical protein